MILDRQNIFGHGWTWLAYDSVPSFRSPHFSKQQTINKPKEDEKTTLASTTPISIITVPNFRSPHFKQTSVKPKEEIKKISTKGEEIFERKAFLGRVSTEITIVESFDPQNKTENLERNSTTLFPINLQPPTVTVNISNGSQSNAAESAPGATKIIAAYNSTIKSKLSSTDSPPEPVTKQRQEEGNGTTESTRESTERCVGFELLEGIAEFSKGLLKVKYFSFRSHQFLKKFSCFNSLSLWE